MGVNEQDNPLDPVKFLSCLSARQRIFSTTPFTEQLEISCDKKLLDRK